MKKKKPEPIDDLYVEKDHSDPKHKPAKGEEEEKEFDTLDPEESVEDRWYGKFTGKTGDRKIDNRRKPEDKPIGNSSSSAYDADFAE